MPGANIYGTWMRRCWASTKADNKVMMKGVFDPLSTSSRYFILQAVRSNVGRGNGFKTAVSSLTGMDQNVNSAIGHLIKRLRY